MALASHQNTQRIDSLDGLRAVAVLIVVAYHIQELGQIQILPNLGINRIFQIGWIGVDLFFVLSGFFIGLAVMRPAVWNLRLFLKRRVRRIIPAYYLSILVLVSLVSSFFLVTPTGLSHILLHILFLHTFFI